MCVRVCAYVLWVSVVLPSLIMILWRHQDEFKAMTDRQKKPCILIPEPFSMRVEL